MLTAEVRVCLISDVTLQSQVDGSDDKEAKRKQSEHKVQYK